MSRIAKNPIIVPEGVTVTPSESAVVVKGKKGEMSLALTSEVTVKAENDNIHVAPRSQSRFARSMWGTTHRLITSMITGVTKGFEKKLELRGVGYRAQMKGNVLVLQLGLSHDVEFPVPEGIQITVPSQTEVVVSGIDKQLVGQTAANIRSYRPPEPYKGKGIRYADERVVMKEGKKK